MVETIDWPDFLVIGIYFLAVIIVGLWASCNKNKGNTHGYFLAGKSMIWLPNLADILAENDGWACNILEIYALLAFILATGKNDKTKSFKCSKVGASVYSSNVGAPMFVGLAGTAAASGLAVTIYEWHAVYIIISLGWFFVPVYVASGAYTMPEYLKMRFGGKRIRIYSSVLQLFLYILRNISGEIFCGAIFMELLLGWNLYLCVCAILAVVAVYTIFGGLRAVLYTDTIQTFVLIVGALTVSILSFQRVGSWDSMVNQYMNASTNYSIANQSLYSCGIPRDDSFHIFRDPVSGDIPWTGSTFGLTILALFVWCQDQLIVQRCLSAKNMSHAKGGTLLAAALKFLSFPVFVLPGMISRILYTDEVACAGPEECMKICQNPSGCSNIAYPLLVIRILPAGVRGLMLAALLAGLMSTLTSVFNSASSIVTLDLWRQFRKKASQTELIIVGRLTVLILVGISILWLPIIQQQQGGKLWFYIAAMCAYLSVPWCIAFLLGLYWKRTTEPAIFWGMFIGLVIGVIRMGLDFAIPAPVCGSGEPDRRFAITAKVDFLHFTILNSIICVIIMVGISLFTEPRTETQLHRVTWWTRHDLADPDLTDDEEEDEIEETADEPKPGIKPMELKQGDHTTLSARVRHILFNTVCGDMRQDKEPVLTSQERSALRKKMTSIHQGSLTSTLLNVCAVGLLIGITFLFGYFA